VDEHHAIERLSVVRLALVRRARATLPTAAQLRGEAPDGLQAALPAEFPAQSPVELPAAAGGASTEAEATLPAGATSATEALLVPLHWSSGERARLQALQLKRWGSVKLASAATMHLAALAHDKHEAAQAQADAAAGAGAARRGSGSAVAAQRLVANAAKALKLAPSPLLPALRSPGGGLNHFGGVVLQVTMASAGVEGPLLLLIILIIIFLIIIFYIIFSCLSCPQVKAKLLFARKRLVCVAQQLWSENASVATAAAAALWMLSRDDATRRALAQLCLDTQAAADGTAAVAAAHAAGARALQPGCRGPGPTRGRRRRHWHHEAHGGGAPGPGGRARGGRGRGGGGRGAAARRAGRGGARRQTRVGARASRTSVRPSTTMANGDLPCECRQRLSPL
jgi:hypothetical protein